MELFHKFGKWEEPRNTKIRKPGMGTFGGAEMVDFVIQIRRCQNCGAIESRVVCEGTIELMGWLTPRAADSSPESPLKNKRQVAKRR